MKRVTVSDLAFIRVADREAAIIMAGQHAPKWPCGHPKTDENTQSVGSAGLRCRICRRRIGAASERRRA